MGRKKEGRLPVSDIPGDLWVIAGKVRGLGELFSMAKGELPMSEDGYQGIAHLLIEIANKIDEVLDTLGNR